MKWNLLNQPLGIGMSVGYSPRKEIPVAIPLALAAGSALSSIFGGSASAAAAREAQAKLDAEKAQLSAERLRARHQTWLDTASGLNTIRMLRENGQKDLQGIKGAAAVGGATEAAVARQKELNNEKEAQVIAQGEAAFQDKKDAVDAGYRQQISGLTQQQIGLERERAGAIAGAASGVSNALGQAAIATFGGTKLGQEMMGAGSPGGGGSTPTPAPTRLQQMATKAPKVEVPAIGNRMFEHQFGRTAPINNRIDWLRNVTAGLKF